MIMFILYYLLTACQFNEHLYNNASATAIVNAQKAFEGAANDFRVNSEADVQRLIDEVRYGEK
jgi:hypothetical protein